MRVILASTSPSRLMLLRQAGLDPQAVGSDVDEDAVVAAATAARGHALAPDAHVQLLARAKAEAVVGRTTGPAVVIGGDSMFALEGTVLGKPHTAAAATARWRAMRGRTGVLHSGHSVALVGHGGAVRWANAVATASVTFADDVDDDEIAAYVATGDPLEVAGAFTLEGRAAPFITRIEGDPSTVIGMSLPTLRTLLRTLGVRWTDTWTSS